MWWRVQTEGGILFFQKGKRVGGQEWDEFRGREIQLLSFRYIRRVRGGGFKQKGNGMSLGGEKSSIERGKMEGDIETTEIPVSNYINVQPKNNQ